MMSANSRILFRLQIVLVCLYITPSHYHHCANLSEDIELIKCLSDFLSSLWVRLSTFSQFFIIQYMGLCVFSLPISIVMIELIYILSYYHDEIGSMNYPLFIRVRSWNNGMRCMYLYSSEVYGLDQPGFTHRNMQQGPKSNRVRNYWDIMYVQDTECNYTHKTVQLWFILGDVWIIHMC